MYCHPVVDPLEQNPSERNAAQLACCGWWECKLRAMCEFLCASHAQEAHTAPPAQRRVKRKRTRTTALAGTAMLILAPLWLEEMWDRKLDDVRRELGIEPATVH